MSPKKPTLTERRIRIAVARFAADTDVHINDLRDAWNLRVRDDHTPIMADVIDVAPFEVVPVWERPGWWTCRPTEEIRRADAYEHAKQEATRWNRRARRAKRWRPGDSLSGTVSTVAAQAQAAEQLMAVMAPNPERHDDACLLRIDRRVNGAS